MAALRVRGAGKEKLPSYLRLGERYRQLQRKETELAALRANIGGGQQEGNSGGGEEQGTEVI
jgi:hypothetical protein